MKAETVKEKLGMIIAAVKQRRKEYEQDRQATEKKIRKYQSSYKRALRKLEKTGTDPEAKREADRNSIILKAYQEHQKRQSVRAWLFSDMMEEEHREALQYIDQLQSQDKEAADLYLEEIRKLYRSGTCWKHGNI